MAGRVRQPIDVGSLNVFLEKHVSQVKAPVDVKQFGYGQSNPTYQLIDSEGTKFVLRKKPAGKLLSKTAHQVEREYQIIAALEHTDVPVPKTYCLCEDNSVIGTPFYIMEFLEGRIFEDPAMPGVPPEERTNLWRAAVETLAKFHSVDFIKIGLKDYGRRSGFYDRQLATWKRITATQEKTVDRVTGEPIGRIPHLDDSLEFFINKKRQPKDRATLVHGDYKPDNMVFHKTEPRVIGILDWEMSTIGHPLSDLCGVLNPWYTQHMRPTYVSDAFASGNTPGLPTPEMIMGWYTNVADWDPQSEINWAIAFSMLRASAICQGIAARAATGQATSEQAKSYGDSFRPLGELSWRMVQEEKKKEATDGAKL